MGGPRASCRYGWSNQEVRSQDCLGGRERRYLFLFSHKKMPANGVLWAERGGSIIQWLVIRKDEGEIVARK